MENQNTKTQLNIVDELDFINIIIVLQKNYRVTLKLTLIFTLISIIFALLTPNTYTASCTIVPQTSQKNSASNIGGLAAIAGISIGNLNSGEILSPNVYSIIFRNINFQKELIYSKYYVSNKSDSITLYDFYTNKKNHNSHILNKIQKYTIGLPGLLFNSIKGVNKKANNFYLNSITKDEAYIFNIIRKNLFLNVNNKDGYISISANMNDPLLAAQLAQNAQELLQKYITKFKIEKVSRNLTFVENNYRESKINFELKQEELAKFRDSNKNLSTSFAKTVEEKLTAEYNLLLGIYTELAKQKEQAKIAVTETTPIFTVIEPVIVPLEKSKPKRLNVVIIITFIGFLFSCIFIILINIVEKRFSTNIRNHRLIRKILN